MAAPVLVAPGCRGVEWLIDVVLVGVALSDLGDQWEVNTYLHNFILLVFLNQSWCPRTS